MPNFIFYGTTVPICGSAWLAIFGSIIACGCYLSRIGAARATDSILLFPLVELLLSTFREGDRWTPAAIGGVLLIAGGNWLTLLKKPVAAPTANPQRP